MEKRELELYVHIPFCTRKCSYCDFLSAAAPDKVHRDYVEQLKKEIQYQSAVCQGYEVISIFLGGGTPSILKPELILSVMAEIRGNFFVREDAEITIECNPGTLTMEKLEVYRQAGINRLSIGLQSANNQELWELGRIHTYEEFLKSYQNARQAGFRNINVDLMSALPGQTMESWERTLKKVLMLRPEHISAYSLIIEEGTPFYERYGNEYSEEQVKIPCEEIRVSEGSAESAEEAFAYTCETKSTEKMDTAVPDILHMAGTADTHARNDWHDEAKFALASENCWPRLKLPQQETEMQIKTEQTVRKKGASSLPDEDTERLMYEITEKILTEHGFQRYEISNYARAGYECRHNIGYWIGTQYLGVGLGAASYLKGCRFHNTEALETYLELDFAAEDVTGLFLDWEELSRNAKMEEFMFLGLRMIKGVSAGEFLSRFRKNIWEIYGDVIEEMLQQRLLKQDGERIALTKMGINLSNRVMSRFLMDQ